MPYDEYLAERIEKVLAEKNVSNELKKMFGGLAFMIKGKMCIGIIKNELMARVGPSFHEEALKNKGARTMDFTGKPMVGYVYVSGEGFDTDEQLEFWVDRCLDFNSTLIQD